MIKYNARTGFGQLIGQIGHSFSILDFHRRGRKMLKQVNSSFGKNVQALRKELNLSRKDLADRAGVSEKTIQRIESITDNQTGKFRTSHLGWIAKALKTTIDKLQPPEETPPGMNENPNRLETFLTCFD
jgi:DNA-binding XRE family transcriptional regulator